MRCLLAINHDEADAETRSKKQTVYRILKKGLPLLESESKKSDTPTGGLVLGR